jgi:DNA polymerase/3'-5' exonuclease PolX
MAKSVVRSFTYVKADGTVSKRTVFVMAESGDYIRGLDFGNLSEEEQKNVQNALADHEISGVVSFGKSKANPIPNFKEEWNSAYRTFKKENIR